MKTTTGVILCAALFSGGVSGAEWRKVGEGVGSSMEVDRMSVTQLKDGQRKAWYRFRYDQPQSLSQGKNFDEIKQLQLHRCDERTVATLQRHFYDSANSSGSAIGSLSIPKDRLVYDEVIPDTQGETGLNYVCRIQLEKR